MHAVPEVKVEQLKESGKRANGKKEKEVKKSISVKFSEVEDVLEKDVHFKVVEVKSPNKF